MANHITLIPVDKTTIHTRLHIDPDFLDDPNAYIHKHRVEIRSTKPTKGHCKRGPTRNLALHLLGYGGIRVKLRKVVDDPLTDATIDFNPGVCLHGHNGHIVTLTEFLDALGLLVTHFKPMLSDPEDWVDLVPGVRKGGVAYWAYIEVPFQCHDPNGHLLAGFRHARHPKLRIVRHWPESIQIGGDRSTLQFAIYLKALEMEAHGKLSEEELLRDKDVLRIEVRMREDRLIHYFGNNRTVEEIEGVKRLVRFYPRDLFQGLRDSLFQLEGVYSSGEPLEEVRPRSQLTPLGRLLARLALDPRTSLTLPDLLDRVKFYTGASSATIGEIRKAGQAVLEHGSAISRETLIPGEAHRWQKCIASENPEKRVFHDFDDTFAHRLIREAYRPPDLPFQPVNRWPSYLTTESPKGL